MESPSLRPFAIDTGKLFGQFPFPYIVAKVAPIFAEAEREGKRRGGGMLTFEYESVPCCFLAPGQSRGFLFPLKTLRVPWVSLCQREMRGRKRRVYTAHLEGEAVSCFETKVLGYT